MQVTAVRLNLMGFVLIALALAISGCQPPATQNLPVELKLENYAGELRVIKLQKGRFQLFGEFLH